MLPRLNPCVWSCIHPFFFNTAPTSVTILLRIIHGVDCRTSKWYCNLPKLHGGAHQLLELRSFPTTFVLLPLRLTSDPTSTKQPCYLYMVANGTFSRFSNHVIFTRVFELVLLVLLKPLCAIIITCSVNIFTSQNLQPKYYFVMSKSTFEQKMSMVEHSKAWSPAPMKQEKRAILVNLRSNKHSEDCLQQSKCTSLLLHQKGDIFFWVNWMCAIITFKFLSHTTTVWVIECRPLQF